MFELATFDKLLKNRSFLFVNKQFIFWDVNERNYVTVDIEESYSAQDYDKLPENAPFQLINSKLFFMPSPTILHQDILLFLASEMRYFVSSQKLGKVFVAPLDVYLDNKNVFQPDIFFISTNNQQIIQKKIVGSPDLVVEILSPATEIKDLNEKMEIYGLKNVQEYWVIFPDKKMVSQYENQNQKMVLTNKFFETGILNSKTIQNFVFDISKLW